MSNSNLRGGEKPRSGQQEKDILPPKDNNGKQFKNKPRGAGYDHEKTAKKGGGNGS